MPARLLRKFQRSNELDGATFDRELSPLAIEQGVVINKDRSLGYGFRLDPPYTPTLGDDVIEGSYAALGGFLNALPEHFDLQVTWTQHSRRAEFELRLAGLEFSPGLLGEVQREQQENIAALLRQGRLRWIEVTLVLVRKLRPEELARAAPATPDRGASGISSPTPAAGSSTTGSGSPRAPPSFSPRRGPLPGSWTAWAGPPSPSTPTP